MGRSFFRVEDCSVEVGGGFRPPDGVSYPGRRLVPPAAVSGPVYFNKAAKHSAVGWKACMQLMGPKCRMTNDAGSTLMHGADTLASVLSMLSHRPCLHFFNPARLSSATTTWAASWKLTRH